MWIHIDRDIRWSGAKVLNMEAINQTKGKRGGIGLVICPEFEFTELYRCAIGVDFEDHKGDTIDPEHLENVTLFNVEDALPNGKVYMGQSIALDTAKRVQKKYRPPQRKAHATEHINT